MFIQRKHERPNEPRFLLDCRPRNNVTIRNHTPIPNIEELIEFVEPKPFWTIIDLANCYFNVRIDPDWEQHSTFITFRGYFRSRVMQQGDCNAPATMVRVMHAILKDMVYKDLVIYIDDIIIAPRTYEEHLATVRKVLPRLQD